MPTVADLLLVEVQVNTGQSAQQVGAVTQSIKGLAPAASAATQTTTGLTGAFDLHTQSALRLAGALVGVNVGLSIFTAIGRTIHNSIGDVVQTTVDFGDAIAHTGAASHATVDELTALSALA